MRTCHGFERVNRAIAIGCALAALDGAALGGGGLFEGLGDLPGGDVTSTPRGVSADGSVIVGSSKSSLGTEAFRWTSGEGMVGLGDLDGGPFESLARAVSANGHVTVGSAHTGVSRGARWSGLGPPSQLPEFKGGGIGGARASGISADGTIIAGYDSGPNGTEAYRIIDGAIEGLGDLEGGDFHSLAFGISADGSTVVGWSRIESGSEPFRWRDGVMVGLGTLEGGAALGEARAASADGRVVVGWSSSGDGHQAFRSIDGGPLEGLGDLGGGDFQSRALDVRDDGAVIVGWGRTAAGREATWWTEDEGLRRFRDVITERGVVIPAGWALEQATGISADGRTVIGIGTNPVGDSEAWRVVLPSPECPGDIDESGAVDFDDLLRILDAWGNEGGPEDLDASGTVDFGDLLIVLDAWGAC